MHNLHLRWKVSLHRCLTLQNLKQLQLLKNVLWFVLTVYWEGITRKFPSFNYFCWFSDSCGLGLRSFKGFPKSALLAMAYLGPRGIQSCNYFLVCALKQPWISSFLDDWFLSNFKPLCQIITINKWSKLAWIVSVFTLLIINLELTYANLTQILDMTRRSAVKGLLPFTSQF